MKTAKEEVYDLVKRSNVQELENIIEKVMHLPVPQSTELEQIFPEKLTMREKLVICSCLKEIIDANRGFVL